MHARPDGSLPPSPRWWKDDPYPGVRRAARLGCVERQLLNQDRQNLVDRLDALDAVAVDWMQQRREALVDAEDIHEALWPTVECDWGRRPPRPGRSPLAPQAVAPRPVRGAVLRSVCMALLRLHEELTLVEMHTLLHLYGYEVEGRAPVKALADRMRYEVLEGRATRPRRGTYRIVGPPSPRHVDPRLELAPERWFPAFVAWQSGGAFSAEGRSDADGPPEERDGLGMVDRGPGDRAPDTALQAARSPAPGRTRGRARPAAGR